MRTVLLILWMSVLASPAVADAVPASIQRALVPLIKGQLLDPDSARITFQSYRHMLSGGWMVCGVVNARNSFGGYAGSKPFVYLATQPQGPITGGVDDENPGMQIDQELCSQ